MLYVGKKSVKNLSFSSSILLTCKSVWLRTFSGRTFFANYFHRFKISIKFSVFWKLICQKRTKKILGSLSTYSGRWKFMPLPLKSKILETPGSLITDDIKMFPLWIWTLILQASLMVQYELSRICNYSATCPQSEHT